MLVDFIGNVRAHSIDPTQKGWSILSSVRDMPQAFLSEQFRSNHE
jgi:hypothetical protein